jgi:predicted nucleic acid-binding protein
MTGRTFVDTNVFLYAVDNSDADKQRRAREVLLATPGITISTQVLNEFYAVATRKLKPPLPGPTTRSLIEGMARYECVPVDADLVLRAVRAGQRWQLSHWDALMLEAARQAACDRVLTEDLADSATYDGVRIQNPFRSEVN